MRERNKQKETNKISLQIKTDFGELTGVFALGEIQKKLAAEFENYFEDSAGYKNYFFATELAEDYLKELLPQILENSLNQVWSEAKARTLHELNNKPCFLIHESTGNNNIETVEVFALPKNEIKKAYRQPFANQARRPK